MLQQVQWKPDVVIVSEFSNDMASAGWVFSRLVGATLVVDMFTGQYETKVLDRKLHSGSSIRGRAALAQDRLALRLADIILTDTATRSAIFSRYVSNRTTHLVVPAGVPEWASSCRAITRTPTSADAPMSILYYGNYIPLHGIPHIVSVLRCLNEFGEWNVTMIGTGQDRWVLDEALKSLPKGVEVRVIDRVPGDELPALIEAHQVILGVFGNGIKAASVIPNKVWQALILGAEVVTRYSDSYNEIPHTAKATLHLVPPDDVLATARAIVVAAHRHNSVTSTISSRRAVDDYLEAGLTRLYQRLTADNRTGRNHVVRTLAAENGSVR